MVVRLLIYRRTLVRLLTYRCLQATDPVRGPGTTAAPSRVGEGAAVVGR
ncbi:hypothetical protein HMPREF0063_11090 [Aeromicrobium marinum DSM 15272]|uniref:Uncharacterized protein n=1 Tax=Aeromicrobium marinum DSM 15272 TaxID=585531 RepID=E2SAN2_9ACTN|nr:hypothetical protein HMPREF0063_11090 [Aeromicrobium marinum DSM 15272]